MAHLIAVLAAVATSFIFTGAPTATSQTLRPLAVPIDDADSPPIAPEDVKVIYRVPTKDKVVFITVDDGGSQPESFGKWLDRNQVAINSFVLPEMLHLNRGWFKSRKYMTFENHTNTHAHMTLISLKRQTAEICKANSLITGIVKSSPRFFRPPRGSWNEETKVAVARCGIRYIVMWNVSADGAKVVVAGNRPLAPGDIIILHYNRGLEASMRNLLDQIKRSGLKPAFLRDYLK